MTDWSIRNGDCRDLLRELDENSVDAIVTDPPYELGFMGKKWDATGVAYSVELWRECLRVLKPGGHMLAFGGSRTYHRIAVAIEDAGFEIRDTLQWLYGTGFPKSLDVSKAIDDAAGAMRKVVGAKPIAYPDSDCWGVPNRNSYGERNGVALFEMAGNGKGGVRPVDAPATDAAKQWQGWGTALKPAYEPIILARKPLVGTVAANVQRWGTGAINVDGCRIEGPGAEAGRKRHGGGIKENHTSFYMPDSHAEMPAGRWPANVILSHSPDCTDGACVPGCAVAMLDEQSGIAPPAKQRISRFREDPIKGAIDFKSGSRATSPLDRGDSGDASRFFYCAKASTAERERGLDHLPKRSAGEPTDREDSTDGLKSPRAGAGRGGGRANVHPTVKPIALMRWLCRLITPPGGLILDPFTGSGTTGCAARMERFRFLGFEQDPAYVQIAFSRIAAHAPEEPAEEQPRQLDLLGGAK